MNVPSFEGQDWKLSLDKDDFLIYTRQVDYSRFNEFLAEAKMNGTIEEFKSIITDVDQYEAWMPDCKSAEIIERRGPDDITYHMKLKVPFPFSNRDIIQQLVLHEKGGILEIDIINRPKKITASKKYVRMLQANGKWIVKEISEDEISIRFRYFADPGGDIPAWLVNSFIVKNPHITLSNIRERLAD